MKNVLKHELTWQIAAGTVLIFVLKMIFDRETPVWFTALSALWLAASVNGAMYGLDEWGRWRAARKERRVAE